MIAYVELHQACRHACANHPALTPLAYSSPPLFTSPVRGNKSRSAAPVQRQKIECAKGQTCPDPLRDRVNLVFYLG